jgi:hypothetical protein
MEATPLIDLWSPALRAPARNVKARMSRLLQISMSMTATDYLCAGKF